MTCENCKSKRVKEVDVGEVFLDGWNRSVQRITLKCLKCGKIWRVLVPVGVEG